MQTQSQPHRRRVRILYHEPCPDGAFAALAAHLRFLNEPDIDLRWVPHQTTKKLAWEGTDLFSPDAELYLLDYCGPEGFIPTVAPKVKKLTLIDHHKTAQDITTKLRSENALPANAEIHLDMNHSGATLALAHFSKEKGGPLLADASKQSRLERLFAYIEDHDLWKHQLPFSKEFSAGFCSRHVEFDANRNPSLFSYLQELDLEQLIEEGKKSIAENDAIIARELASAFQVRLGAGQFGVCLGIITAHAELRSELGNQLAQKSKDAGLRAMGLIAYVDDSLQQKPAADAPPSEKKVRVEKPAAIVLEELPATLKVSLRSLGDEDTTQISTEYHGGGHRNASSFTLRTTTLLSWRL